MSKRDGGKYISNSHKITTISSSSSSNFIGSMTLQQMEENNEHKLVMVVEQNALMSTNPSGKLEDLAVVV